MAAPVGFASLCSPTPHVGRGRVGSHRYAMGVRRSADSCAATAPGRTRSTAARAARSARWCAVDSADRSAVGRSSGSLSALSDVSPLLPAVVPGRDVEAHPSRPRGGSLRAGPDRHLRGFHRRHLCRGQKGGSAVGKTKRGKGTKIMAIADRAGLPIAAGIASASPHEVTLAEETLDNGFFAHAPDRLIGDRAYDSDPLDARLREQRGVELICPHRSSRKRPPTQDGRALRRYRRRWKVERLFAWLQNYRRLITRHERYAENFLGFVHLGCICILLRDF